MMMRLPVLLLVAAVLASAQGHPSMSRRATTASRAEPCRCLPSWTSQDDGGTCGKTQKGCTKDCAEDSQWHWCMIENKGCATEDKEWGGWAYCKPETLDPPQKCECMEKWKEDSTSDVAAACTKDQNGCTNCDGPVENSWCHIKNPGCVNEEDTGGWAYCGKGLEVREKNKGQKCECKDVWRSTSADAPESCKKDQKGCTNCDGTGVEKSWCEIKNPGCVNEEHDGGWAWCKPEPAASTCTDHGTDCDKCLSDKGCWMMTTGDCMSNDQMIADVAVWTFKRDEDVKATCAKRAIQAKDDKTCAAKDGSTCAECTATKISSGTCVAFKGGGCGASGGMRPALEKCPVDVSVGCCDYFDGCNTCSRKDPKSEFMCTKKFCSTQGEKKCNAKCDKPAVDVSVGCCDYFDGCNACSRKDPKSEFMCTEKFCDKQGEKKCNAKCKPKNTAPCDGKKCGDTCKTCTSGICPTVMEYCQADGGECLTDEAKCKQDECSLVKCMAGSTHKCCTDATACEKTRAEAEAKCGGKVGCSSVQCNKDGTYAAEQCHASTGHCWCVDTNGKELDGTRAGPGQAVKCSKQPGTTVAPKMTKADAAVQAVALPDNCQMLKVLSKESGKRHAYQGKNYGSPMKGVHNAACAAECAKKPMCNYWISHESKGCILKYWGLARKKVDGTAYEMHGFCAPLMDKKCEQLGEAGSGDGYRAKRAFKKVAGGATSRSPGGCSQLCAKTAGCNYWIVHNTKGCFMHTETKKKGTKNAELKAGWKKKGYMAHGVCNGYTPGE